MSSDAKAAVMPSELRETLDPFMKDSLVTLLENRPENPIQFLAEYYRHAVHGTRPLSRSYRYIRLTKSNRDAFMGNLMSAYRTLDAKRGIGASSKSSSHTGLTRASFIQLLKMICQDFPLDVIDGILRILRKGPNDLIDFKDFCGGVFACLMYEEFFEQVEWLFKCADSESKGAITGETLVQVIEAVKRQPAQSVSIPSDVELRKYLRAAGVDSSRASEKSLSYQDFVLAIFRVCIPPKFNAEMYPDKSTLIDADVSASQNPRISDTKGNQKKS
mmetsp:Transcript_22901/g.55596  ORF Transcript_22901/g.55596 Transcript_22901/m.55596 type:complete len:274 (+) Transcript_22901:115-936(+)